MSAIKKFAPYVYTAKRNDGSGIYDLFLLVPVGQNGDTDLTQATVTKPDRSRLIISYASSNNGTNAIYRTRHFAVDSDGNQLQYVDIVGNNDPQLTTNINLADADVTPADMNVEEQTFAPYLFAEIETNGDKANVLTSCVILCNNGLGVSNESLLFGEHDIETSFEIGNSNAGADPDKFVINQRLKAALLKDTPFIVHVSIAGNTNYNKPPRKVKVTKIWQT